MYYSFLLNNRFLSSVPVWKPNSVSWRSSKGSLRSISHRINNVSSSCCVCLTSWANDGSYDANSIRILSHSSYQGLPGTLQWLLVSWCRAVQRSEGFVVAANVGGSGVKLEEFSKQTESGITIWCRERNLSKHNPCGITIWCRVRRNKIIPYP